MKQLKLFIIAIMMCLATTGSAQTKVNDAHDYYMYSWIQVRGANKANGDPCFVILESPGLGKKQKPTIMKTDDGRSIIFDNMMDGLNYLELKGWEFILAEKDSFSEWLVRRKVTKRELEEVVKKYTHYETITPKVQLNLAEKNIHLDYE
ncbi:hypothetical protein BFS16_02555 [Hoylesella timonensis]|uniref:Lipocalin-like domain-containing protein n=1 Tax=Hoylesella timonensis TaxID=386414 RepID=A0A2K0XN64_9BACT|nr:hypothetical protein [Hoylesella timonensis]PNP95953.1 hypothetical protein BFS16_02555 [Hoylesella timonensis]